ncbi:F-box/kelch-repeat protein At3g23880-like [Citrus clementina]|uniref:F-box/kelch-repeat protein At3g23880-like n=1 Tax=Citrus clementina TaxID=85681 RepID=UPI000CED0229|nr:F-box/kelch-repeat protein At3g23880-like [Citrus x clementina]
MNPSADYHSTAKAEDQVLEELGDIDLEGKNDKTENVEGQSSFPLDVQEAVLTSCSVKTLLRFKSVSKSYYGLIKSKRFIMEHVKHSVETNTNLNLILTHTVCPVSTSEESWYGQLFIGSLDTTNTSSLEVPLRKIDQPFTDWEQGTDTPFIGSCIGLIALRNSSGSIAVHNPSTKENYHITSFWLGEFDVKDDVCDGFGYNPVDDDYKLVRMIQRRGNIERTEIRVYSFKEGYALEYETEKPFYLGSSCADACFSNGRLYWLVASGPQEDVQDLILSFDLSTAQISSGKIPIDTSGDVYAVFLFPFAGSICVSCVDDGHGSFCQIWKLKDTVNDKKKATVSWERLSFRKNGVFGDGCDFVKPLAYSKCEDKILVDTYNGENEAWNLYRYDQIDKLGHGPISINNVPKGPRDSAICIETLVSFRKIDDEEAESSSKEEEKEVMLSLDEYEKRQKRREVEEKDLTKG